jgi:hypothetical protein
MMAVMNRDGLGITIRHSLEKGRPRADQIHVALHGLRAGLSPTAENDSSRSSPVRSMPRQAA